MGRELQQTLSELTSEAVYWLYFVQVYRMFPPQSGSLCLPKFPRWVAQIFLNLCLGESLVGLTTVPAIEVVLRVIIDTYFSLY